MAIYRCIECGYDSENLDDFEWIDDKFRCKGEHKNSSQSD